ncbi:MAG: DUF1479 family protein [Myxococcales bacterium]|nr:DUF1479 family protein [Myxococcales bacterium]
MSLSRDELDHFRARGYLVKRGVVPPLLLAQHQREVAAALRARGVMPEALGATADKLSAFGSGFGGFLELYHLPAMAEMRALPEVVQVFTALLEATYASSDDVDAPWPNAYGRFDARRLYAYINRCSYRVPTRYAAQPGRRPAQRGTGPHLDIHPLRPFEGVRVVRGDDGRKRWEPDSLRFWHPLQGLVAVSGAPEANSGGFCTIPGFHRRCRAYFEEVGLHGRHPLRWGNATHLTRTHDAALLERFEHVPTRPGDLLIWDFRMPHMSEDRNDRDTPREAVYLTYLPDVENNRAYARTQREWYLAGVHPDYVARRYRALETPGYRPFPYGPLGRQLLALDPWGDADADARSR